MVSDDDPAKRHFPELETPPPPSEFGDPQIPHGFFTQMCSFFAWAFLILAGVIAFGLFSNLDNGNSVYGRSNPALSVIFAMPAFVGTLVASATVGALGEISRKLTVLANATRNTNEKS